MLPKRFHSTTNLLCLLCLLVTVSILLFNRDLGLNTILTKPTNASRRLLDSTQSMVSKVLFSDPTVTYNLSVKGGIKTVFQFGQHLQLLSAVAGNSSRNASWDRVVIQGWEYRTLVNRTYVCCFVNGDKFIYTRLRTKMHWGALTSSRMAAKQFECPVPKPLTELQGVTLSGNKDCITKKSWYLPIEKAYRHEDQIAICAKLVYGKVRADDLLSWFEFHRRLGVDQILLFTNNVDAEAQRVLNYYQSVGILEMHNFQLPSKGNHPPVGTKNMQAWNDEQVVVFECQERLKGYKYLVLFDIDEYLVPTRQNETLKQLFDRMFQLKRNATGFNFKTQILFTTWGVTGDGTSPFKVMRYVNRTMAMSNRPKHVTMPSRLFPGGLSTHHFRPLSTEFKKYIADIKDVVLYHYRECRKGWFKTKNAVTCDNIDRYTDWKVYGMFQPIHDRLLQLRSLLLADTGSRTSLKTNVTLIK